MSISRPRRLGYRTAIVAVVPAVAATFLLGSALPASASVSPVAPQRAWNWGTATSSTVVS